MTLKLRHLVKRNPRASKLGTLGSFKKEGRREEEGDGGGIQGSWKQNFSQLSPPSGEGSYPSMQKFLVFLGIKKQFQICQRDSWTSFGGFATYFSARNFFQNEACVSFLS